MTMRIGAKAWLVGGLVSLMVACAPEGHTFSGVVSDRPQAAPDFRLTDESGRAFALSDEKGRWILLAYGYTTCPDVCPLTLAHLRDVKKAIGPNADQVAVVFVSVDPERDTVDVMRRYVRHFGDDFKGLTGTLDQVAIAAKAYGVKYEKQPLDSAAGYSVSHTAYVYLIDPHFKLRLTFPFGVKPEEMVADLKYLMAQ
jgi:protein SCO1/2